MKYTTEELEDLVNDFQLSRERSLQVLFTLHYDPLIYFANQYIKNIELAEEIVADSFVKLWNRRTDFKHYNQIRSYLYVCTKNAAINTLRDTKVAFQTYAMDDLENIIHDDTDLLDNIIKTELLTLMYAKLEELPEKQRHVFQLIYLEDLSSEEVSKRLGISLESVYTHKSRAMLTLKRKLKLDTIVILCVAEAAKKIFDY